MLERLFQRGTEGIGDGELLAMVLASPYERPRSAAGERLVDAARGLGSLSRASLAELTRTHGVSSGGAARLVAAFELGRRAAEVVPRRPLIASPECVHRVLAPRVASCSQEMFFVLGLDVRQCLIETVEIARGSVFGVETHPREVFRPLVRMAAAAVVLAHNHPSGDPTPSPEDLDLTRRLREVGILLGIPVVDHVVLGARSYRSIVEWAGPDLDAHPRP